DRAATSGLSVTWAPLTLSVPMTSFMGSAWLGGRPSMNFLMLNCVPDISMTIWGLVMSMVLILMGLSRSSLTLTSTPMLPRDIICVVLKPAGASMSKLFSFTDWPNNETLADLSVVGTLSEALAWVCTVRRTISSSFINTTATAMTTMSTMASTIHLTMRMAEDFLGSAGAGVGVFSVVMASLWRFERYTTTCNV